MGDVLKDTGGLWILQVRRKHLRGFKLLNDKEDV